MKQRNNVRHLHQQKTKRSLIPLTLTLVIFLNQANVGAQVARNSGQSANSQALPGDAQKNLEDAQQALEGVVQTLERGGDAPKTDKDIFHLTLQTRTERNRTDSLSEVNLGLKDIQIIDFEKDIKIQSTMNGLVFEMGNGQKSIQHTLPQFRPLVWAQDKELLIFLDTSGTIFGIDIGLARSLLFNGPLPVFRVGKMPSTLMNGSLQMAFVSRKTLPPDFIHTGAINPEDRSGKYLQAGDLIIYSSSPDGKVGQKALLDRNVLTTNISRDEALLASLAFKTSLPENTESLLQTMVELERETRPAFVESDDLVKEAIQNLGNKAVLELLVQSRVNGASGPKPMRDKFSPDEVRAQQLQAQALIGQPQSPRATWLQKSLKLVRPVLTPKALTILAATLTGGAFVLNSPEAKVGLEWAVYLTHEMYDLFLPEVLKDSAYRITLLKSSVALASFVPLLLGVGYAYNSILKLPGPAIRGIATLSFRVYGALCLPFWHRIVVALKQDTFMVALREGINPLRKITPESYLGQKVGLTKPQRVGISPLTAAGADIQEKNGQILTELNKNRARLKALAWKISMIVAAEKMSLDPATLSLSISENGIDDVLNKISQDPQLQEKWSQLAKEFHLTLLKMKKGLLSEDMKQISVDEIAEMIKMATEKSSQIENRSKLAAIGKALHLKFHDLLSSTSRNAAQFGLAEYEFLRQAKPADFVASTMWRQFVTDYLLSVTQVGLVGDRANLASPGDLAAAEGRLLWTSPGHRYDMIDQVQIYGIVLSARLGLVYQKAASHRETSYDPVESASLTGLTQQENFFKGLGRYSKHALNINAAKYGDVFLRDFVKRIKTIQAGFLMTVVGRMIFGGQALAEAAAAFAFTTIWGEWAYLWTWKPLRQASIGSEEDMAKRTFALSEAKTTLGRGLRLEDPHSITEGYRRLAELYTLPDSQILPEPIEQLIRNAHSITDATSGLWADGITNLEPALLRRLQLAIVSGRPEALAESREAIRAHYGIDTTSRSGGPNLEALELLIHSLKNPPYSTKVNGGVEWLGTMVGAVASTYLATSMMVSTFQSNISWSEKIAEAGLLSAGLYGAVFLGQKVIERGVTKYDQWKSLGNSNFKASSYLGAIFGQKTKGAILCSKILNH